jgi:hypothetical protein
MLTRRSGFALLRIALMTSAFLLVGAAIAPLLRGQAEPEEPEVATISMFGGTDVCHVSCYSTNKKFYTWVPYYTPPECAVCHYGAFDPSETAPDDGDGDSDDCLRECLTVTYFED